MLKVMQIIRRTGGRTQESEVFYKMRQATLSRPPLFNEAAFISHKQPQSWFMAAPGENSEPNTVLQATADDRLPVTATGSCFFSLSNRGPGGFWQIPRVQCRGADRQYKHGQTR